jgi:hypothetical protein
LLFGMSAMSYLSVGSRIGRAVVAADRRSVPGARSEQTPGP